jgi:hypothetical protein
MHQWAQTAPENTAEEIPERSLAELAKLLERDGGTASSLLEDAVLISTIARLKALGDFQQAFHGIFAAECAADTNLRKSMRVRLVRGLDVILDLLRALDINNLSSDVDELRFALRDVDRGVRHPLFQPAQTTKTDPSILWRAKSNFVLAIEARRARSKVSFSDAAEAVLSVAGHRNLARQITRKKSKHDDTLADEKRSLKKTLGQWRKDLRTRPQTEESGELYRNTKTIIEAYKSNESMLRRIEARCLKFARYDASIGGKG